MKTVKDFLEACDELSQMEVHPSPESEKHSLIVLKHSVLYLVSTKKLKLNDPIDEWKKYWGEFDLKDHYKVANVYLKRLNKPPFNFTEEKFHNTESEQMFSGMDQWR